MKSAFFACVSAALCTVTSVNAMEVTGGSIELKYSAFTNETDFDRLSIEGSVEVGFSQNFSLQIDLGHRDFGASDIDATNYALHGIYHVNEALSLGAFVGRDDIEDADVDVYGIEAGYEVGTWDFEGYLASLEAEGEDELLIGLGGRYEFASGLGLSLGFANIGDNDLIDVTTTALKIDKDVNPNFNLFAEIGTVTVDVTGQDETEPFVGIGAEFVFGAERGATFEQRGLSRLLPGL